MQNKTIKEYEVYFVNESKLGDKIDVYKKLKELYPCENKYYYAGIVGQINENNATEVFEKIAEIQSRKTAFKKTDDE